jgi:hypothetical protein
LSHSTEEIPTDNLLRDEIYTLELKLRSANEATHHWQRRAIRFEQMYNDQHRHLTFAVVCLALSVIVGWTI